MSLQRVFQKSFLFGDLANQPTPSRFENVVSVRSLLRLRDDFIEQFIEQFIASFEELRSTAETFGRGCGEWWCRTIW